MVALAYAGDDERTSAELAWCVNTSPSFVRRVLAKLSKAGLVRTRTGQKGACELAKAADKISLREIYQAVDAPKAFAIHHYKERKDCAVSCNIKAALEKALGKAQQALEAGLKNISLGDVLADVRRR
jgi:Rrf2 family protein